MSAAGLSPMIVRIEAEASALTAAIDEFAELVSGLELPKEVLDLLVGLAQCPDGLVRINSGIDAAATNQVLVTLEPSDGFRMLLAAARAGKLDRFAVEHAFPHLNSPSSVGVAASGEAESGKAVNALPGSVKSGMGI